MREPTKFVLTAIALMWLMVFPRPNATQALQEIRIGSSVIGFSSLMSYFARDLITKPVEPETLVDFSFAKGL